MARTTMEAAIVSVERVEFDNVKLIKLFVADEPDGKRDLITSLLSMQVADEAMDEVWASCQGLHLGEAVRITAEVDRGSKNAGKFIVLHVEPVAAARASEPGSPARQATQQQPNPAAKPATEQPKA